MGGGNDTGNGTDPSRDTGTDLGDGTNTRTDPEEPKSYLNFGTWLPWLSAASIDNTTSTVTGSDTQTDTNTDPDTCVDADTDSVDCNVKYPTVTGNIEAWTILFSLL
jgi:hypothetical protein